MNNINGIEMKAGNNNSIKVGDVNINVSKPKKRKKNYDKQDFNVPQEEDSIFVGRNDILEQLNDLFFKQNKRKVALYGLPGYGKTETAKRFIKKCKNNKITHILWLNASTLKDLNESFENIATNLNFVQGNDINMVLKQFDTEKTIIVFDNAPDRKTISAYITAASNFYCIITSHVRYWTDGIEAIEIKELPFESALEILHYKLEKYQSYISENSGLLKELVEFLGQAALPIQIIGSYIAYRVDMQDGYFNLSGYVTKLKFSQEEFIEKCDKNCESCKLSSVSYSKSLYEAMKICFDKISNNELASNLLYICSYLNPEHIFYETILSKMKNISNESNPLISEAVILLKLFSLIKVDFKTKKLSMHRFIQKIVRYHVSKCNAQLQNKIYSCCMQLTLSNSHYYHIPSIIKCADSSDEHINTFFNFYSSNFDIYETNEKYTKLDSWEAKCTGLQLILESLIEGRCIKSLEKTLAHLEPKTKYYINKFRLLNVATMTDDANIFKLLLIYKPSINQTDKDGHCAIHAAVFKWNENLIDLLLKYDANKTLKDKNNYSLLSLFIKGSYYTTKASIDIEKAKRILEKIKSTEEIRDIKNGPGESLLHESAAAIQPELVELFIHNFGIDANIRDKLGYTPLHSLIYKASTYKGDEQRIIKTAKVLLDNNARIEIANVFGTTPMEYAIRFEVHCLVKLFNNIKESKPETTTQE